MNCEKDLVMGLKIHEFQKREKLLFLTNSKTLIYQDEIKLFPRIPRRRAGYEDNQIKRICLGTKLYRILKAIPVEESNNPRYGNECILSVFKAIKFNPNKIVEPTVNEVEDIKVTHELWSLSPVKLKKIGKLKLYNYEYTWYYEKDINNHKILVGSRKNIKWEWINKPNEKIWE